MKNTMVSRVVTAMVLMAGMGSAQVAEKIRWEGLQERLGKSVEIRSANVITRDGQKYHGQRLAFRSDHVGLYGRDRLVMALRRQDVARIEIRQRKRYYRQIAASAAAPAVFVLFGILSSKPAVAAVCFTLAAALTPPSLALAAASAPAFIAAEAVAFLKPARIFEIAQ